MMTQRAYGRALYDVSYYAEIIGVPAVTLYQIGEGRMDLKARQVAPLTNGSGDFLLLEAIAEAAHSMVLPCPRPVNAPGHEALTEIANAAKEQSDVIREMASAIADGKVSEEELARIDRELVEAQAQLSKARGLLGSMKAAPANGRVKTLAATQDAHRRGMQ